MKKSLLMILVSITILIFLIGCGSKGGIQIPPEEDIIDRLPAIVADPGENNVEIVIPSGNETPEVPTDYLSDEEPVYPESDEGLPVIIEDEPVEAPVIDDPAANIVPPPIGPLAEGPAESPV